MYLLGKDTVQKGTLKSKPVSSSNSVKAEGKAEAEIFGKTAAILTVL